MPTFIFGVTLVTLVTLSTITASYIIKRFYGVKKSRVHKALAELVVIPLLAFLCVIITILILPAYSPVVTMQNASGQQLVFVGMQHVGIKTYYESINSMVMSLRDEDYTILHEGVGASGDVSVTLRSCALVKPSSSRYGIVDQPECIGELHAGDKYADLTQDEFLSLYAAYLQEELGVTELKAKQLVVEKIEAIQEEREDMLNNFTSFLGLKMASLYFSAKYWSVSMDSEIVNDDPIIMGARNSRLAQYITKENKSATAYGLAHIPGVINELSSIDPTWSITAVDRIRAL